MTNKPLSEARITSLIVESFARDFGEVIEMDVAIVGAGPAGLTAARLLAGDGLNVSVFERKRWPLPSSSLRSSG